MEQGFTPGFVLPAPSSNVPLGSRHLPARTRGRCQRSLGCPGNLGNYYVASCGWPIIIIGDGFVLTRHDGLEGNADLSYGILGRLARSLVGRRWSLYDICSSQRGGLT